MAQIIRSAATGGSTSGENCIGSPGRVIKSVSHGGIRRRRRDSGPPRYDIAVSAVRVRLFSPQLLLPPAAPPICVRDVAAAESYYSLFALRDRTVVNVALLFNFVLAIRDRYRSILLILTINVVRKLV